MTEKVDQIADLLIGEEPETTEDLNEVEESEEIEAAVSEEQNEEEEEDDLTWAGTLKVDESKLALDEDGNFTGIKIKVDGEESTVDLNTLIAGYQTAKSTTRKSQALAEQRRIMESERSEMLQGLSNRLKEAEQFTHALGSRMMAEFQGVNWQELRARNPAEYAAMMSDMQARDADIRNMRAQIQQYLQHVSAEEQRNFEQSRQAHLQDAATRTLEMFPEWSNPEAASKDFKEMRNFVTNFGFNDEDFKSISDPRIFAVLKTVIRQNAQTEAPGQKKLPKIRPATRTRQRSSSRLDRLVKRAKSATGTNKRNAQTDAIAELLMSGDK